MRKWSRCVRPVAGASRIGLSNDALPGAHQSAEAAPRIPSGASYNKASSLLGLRHPSEGQILRFLEILPELTGKGDDAPLRPWAVEILTDIELGPGVKLALLEDAIRRGDQAAGKP